MSDDDGSAIISLPQLSSFSRARLGSRDTSPNNNNTNTSPIDLTHSSRPSALQQAHTFRVANYLCISIGLRWEYIGATPIDLDASCVLFNDVGECTEAVFYNNLRNKTGSVVHSGDNTTGEDEGEDDESITVDFSRIPDEVCEIMVCATSPKGIDFGHVSAASCRLINARTSHVLDHFAIRVVGKHTATILCSFVRRAEDDQREAHWELIELNSPGHGRTWADLLPQMQTLLDAGIRERAAKLQTSFDGPRSPVSPLATVPTYDLTKQASTDINLTDTSILKFGVGWDGENDVDALMIMLDEKGTVVDYVIPKNGKTRSLDGSSRHSGDTMHGYDKRGDDEDIVVELAKVTLRATRLYFAMVLVTGEERGLSTVPESFARLANRTHNSREIARATPKYLSANKTAHVLCCVFRDPEKGHAWNLQQINEGTYGRRWEAILPYLRAYNRHLLGQKQADGASSSSSSWALWKLRSSAVLSIEVGIKEVRDLAPLEPHHFRCHCRAWIIDNTDSICAAQRNRTSYCTNRDACVFEPNCFHFVGSMDDGIRIMVFEHALVAFADIPLHTLQFDPTQEAEHTLEQWFPLCGYDVEGEVLVQLTICTGRRDGQLRRFSSGNLRHKEEAAERGSSSSFGGWCVVM
eukprot:PhM_4_TR3236/c0_g1_i1/m.56989